MDVVNPQMLGCIICGIEQTYGNSLFPTSTLKKALMKYNKTNLGITLMRFHVDSTHPRLVAQWRVWIVVENFVMETSHNW